MEIMKRIICNLLNSTVIYNFKKYKIRNSVDEFYSRLEVAKEKICELDYQSVENIHNEA